MTLMCLNLKRTAFFLFPILFLLFSYSAFALPSPSVINASLQGSITLNYDKYPYVFREQPTLMLINVTGSINNSVIGDADVYLNFLNTTYLFAFSPYYQCYAFELVVYSNESFAYLPYLIYAEKANYSFNTLASMWIVTNETSVTVRLFKDNEGSSPYVNNRGYIFATKTNSDVAKIRNQQENLFSPLPHLTTWGSRVFGMNYSSLYVYPFEVFHSSYINGKAVLALPADADYSFYFVAGDFFFTPDFEQKPVYLTKTYDVFLSSVHLEQGEKSYNYVISDWDLNYWDVIIRYLIVYGLLLISLIFALIGVKQTGDVRLLFYWFMGAVFVLVPFSFILKIFLEAI